MGKLILIRHGQSVWNLENRFTGWIDVSLSKKGIEEAKKAGEILKDIKFDMAFTSNLMRAQETLFEILNLNLKSSKFIKIHDEKSNHLNWYSNILEAVIDENEIKVKSSELLNERYYGDLQGLNKDETKKKYGEEQVHIWRRSFDIAPPNGESLKDTYNRTIPYFNEEIAKELKLGKNIIIAAHGNSLRSIIMEIEKLSGDEIMKIELETGIPIEYDLDENLNILNKRILN